MSSKYPANILVLLPTSCSLRTLLSIVIPTPTPLFSSVQFQIMNLKEKSTRSFEWSTIEVLETDIVECWVNLVGRKFVLHLAKGEDSDIFYDISQLQQDKFLYLKVTQKGFSKMPDDRKWSDIPTMQSEFPLHDVDAVKLAAEVNTVFNEVQRRIAYIDQKESSEYTMREFISPILLGALAIYDTSNLEEMHPLQLVCEKQVTGEIGTGPVDYVVTYKKMNIILTEAKKEKIDTGIQQNLRQQEASRQEYVREVARMTNAQGKLKRKYDELLFTCEKIPLYGIVSTGEDWIFLRHCPGDVDDSKRLIISQKRTLTLTEGTLYEERRMQDIGLLLQMIAEILNKQVTVVNNLPPDLKRLRSHSIDSKKDIIAPDEGNSSGSKRKDSTHDSEI